MSIDTTPCSVCGRTPTPNRLDYSDHVTYLCDDCGFERLGDLFTINELRRCDLRETENRRRRDEWVAKRERAGLDPDQDPSFFVLYVEAD